MIEYDEESYCQVILLYSSSLYACLSVSLHVCVRISLCLCVCVLTCTGLPSPLKVRGEFSMTGTPLSLLTTPLHLSRYTTLHFTLLYATLLFLTLLHFNGFPPYTPFSLTFSISSCSVLSFPILSYLTLSYLTLSYLISHSVVSQMSGLSAHQLEMFYGLQKSMDRSG